MSIIEDELGPNTTLEKFQKAVKLTSIIQQHHASDDIVHKAQKALIKPYIIRSSEDFTAIEKYMIQVKFFTKLKLRHGLLVFKEVCKYLYYKRVQPETKIIQINKEGKTFYVILRGSVGINIYLQKATDLFEEEEINVLQAGDSFGELALLDPDAKTIATVKAKDTTELACLDKEQFVKILGVINQAEMNDKMNFVRSIHFLSKWFENDLKTLSFHFECLYLDRKEHVFREGEPTDGYIYFLKKGEVALSKTHARQQITVCSLVVGEVFGEDEYKEFTRRQYTAMVTQENTQLYRLAKVDLDRRMSLPELRQQFTDSLELRWSWRMKRYENLKPVEVNAAEKDENLTAYLKPDCFFVNEMIRQQKKAKISSFTISKEFDFMEPTTSIQYVKPGTTKIQRRTYQRQKSQAVLQQLCSTANTNKRQKIENHERENRKQKQLLREYFLFKIEQDEILEEKLPFNFVTQEAVDQEKRRSLFSRKSSHKTLIDDVNSVASILKSRLISKGYNNASQNMIPQSMKNSELMKSKSKLSINEFSSKSKSPPKPAYELIETKNSLRFRRFLRPA